MTERPREPLTPAAVENKLRTLVNQITEIQGELASARNAENDAWINLEKAKVLAALSEDCPKVVRGSVTVGDREAWIAEQVLDENIKHHTAITVREIAQESLRAVLAQSSIVQSLGQSVRTAYSVAGVA